eukprot:gene1287-740_t
MTFINNNNPREDTTFRIKVKEPMVRHHGPGGVVSALLAFQAAHADATRKGQPGMDYEAFLSCLRSQGVELRPSEATYMCRCFDDSESGFISPKTFTRHLLGLNARRMAVVDQSWATLPRDDNGDVAIADIVEAHEAINGANSSLRTGIRSAFSAKKTFDNREKAGRNPDTVSYAEFVAYAAALSLSFKTDEEFQKHMLRQWKSDKPAAPLLDETERDWGEGGDPLEIGAPLYVKDAINFELGRSSKQYNYTHNQRYWRDGIPLPQVDRPGIMVTTVQRTYVPYSKQEQDAADPLETRRGQLY